MKQTFAIIGIFILGIAAFIGLGFGMGWINVGYTNTVGKAQQNAERHVFEQTQSYVEGKRQELVNRHHEWVTASKDDKAAIEANVRQSFANFDKNKIEDIDMAAFLQECMNK